jgi:hypothetical protein
MTVTNAVPKLIAVVAVALASLVEAVKQVPKEITAVTGRVGLSVAPIDRKTLALVIAKRATYEVGLAPARDLKLATATRLLDD